MIPGCGSSGFPASLVALAGGAGVAVEDGEGVGAGRDGVRVPAAAGTRLGVFDALTLWVGPGEAVA